ncbi:putative uncharacterized protein [Clostridium sp. CAG:510]|nr:putative uncharacterized protein [Clostridium sp. CAG:510]
MKLKYYLRGLGIGILVTTVILSLAGVGRKNMTDEEVVKRAKELGMVESTLLSDLPDQTKTDEVRPTEPEISLQPETSEPEESASTPETPVAPEETPMAPEETPEAPEETPVAPEETPVSPEDGNPDIPAGETVTLVIGRGESSTTVSKNLKKAGIVEDAAAFDRFLCNNGYDKKIITGTYEIPYGASEEEIAKIITRK